MKLATLRDGSRDGQLVVVSRDLAQAHYASGIADCLQQVLDDWNFLAPQLQELCAQLNAGRARHAFAFDPSLCLAPLPRAFGWARCDAYAAAEPAAAAWTQEAGAPLLPPRASWPMGDLQELGFLAGWAALTGELERACTAEQASESVRLLTLALGLLAPGGRNLLASAFAPVVLTPDELAHGWHAGRLALGLQVQLNGRSFGLCDMAAQMPHGLGEWLAALAQARPLACGALVGALPVRDADAGKGHGSLADKRAAEVAGEGQARTPWLRAGDVLRVQARQPGTEAGPFGAIELQIT
ncbi:fumarylacetoacetate hydrolase family protein [Comamonas flocculans]|uniref:Fumarylacetoacetate hydrolase n=1 Tax=Comamonas flocculans TaxID=2597701 RepID=A0A5B8RV51_9BURK|nr:fumarylacetoacetate hydrolase family protein [Comamonas flocculans]QEA12638.1 fumarylacetoacetate hydrolase [Comamonas flocculans]